MSLVVIEAVDDDGIDEASLLVVSEFKKYKQVSLQQTQKNFATPNEESYQKQLISVHPLFGRDRIFDFPQHLATEIFGENLAHIHIDTDGQWDESKLQWYATSKNALIYSAFIHAGGPVFVVHDILKDFDENDTKGAHAYYESHDIANWLELARWHRTNYPHTDQRIV